MCQENSVILGQAQSENRAGLALGDHFKWPAANFAVGGESLRGDAGVDDQSDALAAERALKGRADFHTLATHLRKCAQSQSRRKTSSRATPQRPHACFKYFASGARTALSAWFNHFAKIPPGHCCPRSFLDQPYAGRR